MKTEQDPELDMTFEYYQYPSKWFDLPQTVPTVFQCRAYQMDGATQRSLEQVMIYTEGWELSQGQLESLLTQRYGEPIVYEDGAKVWGGENNKYLKQYQIGEWDRAAVLCSLQVILAVVGLIRPTI